MHAMRHVADQFPRTLPYSRSFVSHLRDLQLLQDSRVRVYDFDQTILRICYLDLRSDTEPKTQSHWHLIKAWHLSYSWNDLKY